MPTCFLRLDLNEATVSFLKYFKERQAHFFKFIFLLSIFLAKPQKANSCVARKQPLPLSLSPSSHAPPPSFPPHSGFANVSLFSH